MKSVALLQGAGGAALVLFPLYGNVIDSPSALRMHTPAPITTFVLSIVVNLILTSFVFVLVYRWLRRNHRWMSLKLPLPALILASIAEMIYITWIGVGSAHLWIVVLIAVIAVTACWRRGEQLLLQLCGVTLIGLGFFCVFVILQLLYLATWRPLPNSTHQISASTTISTNHSRIVWILFDELSYDQVFGHRYSDLQLPNFDEFRNSATVFTNVHPVVNQTEKAVPSILLGQVVNRVQYIFRNQLEVGVGSSALHPFDPARTPFALAQREGLTTGVVGWYNPYCSMLAPYLNECYWTDEMLAPPVFARESFWQNLMEPWNNYGRVFHPRKQQKLVAYRVSVYQDLMRHTYNMLQPSGPDFVFLHLPVPHPPGFFDRNTRQFDTSGKRSYLDNLALADYTLGQMMTILEKSPRWKSTSVVVCGDHSWRVYTWSRSHYWTAEDQSASRERIFDPRPMIMVHLAGQQTSAAVNTPFSLLGVHNILDHLIEGKRTSNSSANH